MGEVYTYDDATHLTTIRDGEVELTQNAEMGAVGNGRVVIWDAAGTIAIVGQKNFLATQSSCALTRTFRGFIDVRSYTRENDPKVQASRDIEAEVVDLNAMLGFRLIRGSDGKRPAETVAERGAWLMAQDAVSGLFIDNGRVDFPSGVGMDKADYRNQTPGDVLGDMALATGTHNYHVQDYGSGPELIFRDDNASTADSSSLRISNVLGDASSTTYHPKDTVLRRDPGRVKSDIVLTYAKGSVHEDRDATATAFNGERWGVASNSNIKTEAKAREEAVDQLWQMHTEEDIIECALEAVTDAHVNLIMPGYRIQAKFSHLATEGYGSFTWFRVLSRTVKPLVAEGALYELRLKLSPQEEGLAVGQIIQSDFAFWGTGGSGFSPYSHLPNPPTIGNQLLVAISRRVGNNTGTQTVNAPNIDPDLPRWGAGAWTELPLDIGGFTSTYVEATAGDGAHHTISFFWKDVDSTDQDCAILNDYQNVGVWETSGVDYSTATLVRANNQAAATTFDVGTLGTVASGELAFMIVHSVPDEPGTSAQYMTPAAGWVKDWERGSYPIWYTWATFPVVWMGHAVGTGATVDPALTHAWTARRWCGLAIKVGP